MISVRIISLDYYMSYPIHSLDVEYSEFRGIEVKQVPVIQIFGAFQEGHKTCLNVHGVFPYIYIPYDGSEPAGNLSYKIATELDKALNTSLGQSSSNTVHVHSIVLVSSRPFYGYHKNNHQFFKICFYNPAIVKKACGLLENGAILGKNFQPHESHINYILQFMIDYNLHGMSFINISEAFYRNSPDYPGLLDDIPPNLILSNEIQRRSTCKFELDAFAANILNKKELEGGKSVINPGIAALWADEKQRRRDKGKDSQISFNLTQERNEMPPTESHIFFANKLTEKLMQQSDETSFDLDSSVYPAETPENVDFSNASSVLNETINFEPSETNEDDEKLFKILLDLKESAEVEEDSLLSQQVAPQEAESVEEDLNLSLPLEKIVLSGDSIWENSFWDNCDEIPQIDGLYDTDTSENDSLASSKHLEIDKEYRIASEVYVNFSDDIPESKKLKPGMNKLIAIRRKSPVSKNNGIKIISDVSIKGAKDTEKDKIYNNYPINDVIINDVTLYSTSPDSEDSIFEFTLDTLFETQSNLNTPPGSPQLYDNFEELFFDEFKLPETEKSPEKPSGIKMPKFKVVSKDETAKKLKETSKNCLRVSKGGTKKTRTRNRNKCSCIKVPEKMLNMLLNVKINPTLSQKFASKCSLSPERDKRNKECNYIQVIEDEQNSEETPINNEINFSENVSSKEDDQYAFLDRISPMIPRQILENDPESIDNAIENTQQEEAKPVENKYQIDKLPIDFNLLIENWSLVIEAEEDNNSQKITGENNNNEKESSQNYSEEIAKSEMQIKWKHYWEFQEISKNLLDNTANKEISTIIDKMSTLLSTNKEISSEHKETSINDESTSKLEFTNASANEETSKTLSIHEELSAKFASADKEISKSPSINEKLSSKLEPTTTNTSFPQNLSSKLGLKMANVSVEEKMASKNEVISRIPSIHDEMSCKINPALDNAVINGEISSKLKQLLSKLELLTTNASIEEEITSKYEKTQSIHEEITSRINSTWVNAMINEEMSLELELSAKPNKVLVNEELSSKREICTADTSVDEKIASEHESSNGALFHEELSPKHDSVDEKILKVPSIQKENSKINLTSDKAIKNGEMSTHGKICSEINLTSDIASISGESFAELNFTSDKASVNGETSNYPAANEAVSKELSQKSIDQNLYSLFEKECIISSTDASINKELSKTSSSDENFDQINKQHWNLDGQDDTPSDSVSSVEETAPLEIQTKKQTKIIKKKKKVSCRAPGLSKKSTKNGNNYINLISPENSEDEKSKSEINHKRQVGSNFAKAATRANIFKKDLQVVLTPLPSSVLKTVHQKQIHFFSASEDEDLDLETRKLMQKDKNANIYIDSSENEQLTQIEPENQPKITEKNISLSSSTEEEIAVNLKAKRLKKKPAAIKTCLRNRITGNSVRNEVMKICSSSSDEQEVISAKKPKLSKWSRRKYSRLATKKLVDCTEKVQKKEADKSVDKDQDFISRVTQSKNLPKNTRSKQIISNNKDSPKSQQTEHQNIFSKIPLVQLVRITPEQFSGSSKDYEIISSNSSTEIKDIVVEKHTSPKKMLPSKYSPLKVIRSPRKHRQLIRKEDEPLAKRLRNNIEGVTAMKYSNMNKTEKASKSANGTGELKKVPILLKDCKKASPAVENVPQICDIVVTIRSPNSINRSIKKNLFNSDDTPTKKIESKHDINLNLNYVQEIREKEEQFMKQFEENSAENINNNNTHLKSYNNQSIPVPRIVKKKDKKLVPLIRPKDSNYIYFSPIKATKNDSINLVETLSQQNENELIHIDKYNTKIRNLTAAEKYDLEKNFAPQPGCSKIIEEEEIDNGSSNYSFSYEFSLMDNTFLDKTITNGDIIKIWMPKYLPPSRDDVQNTLPVYNIPENRFQEPFYSNYSDVTGKIDIGHNVLKISSNTVADLDDFESCLDFSIDKWRKVKFNDVYPSDTIVKNIKVTLAGHKKIVITPVIQPPSRKQILKWIEAENNKIETKTEVKIEKPRVLIIGSPGNSNDSFNELTLSPFTPESSKSSQITIESSQNTPTSSSSSKTIQRENLQRKALFMSQKPQEKLKLINIPDNQTINNSCQITGVTLNNTHGFETSLENLQDAKAISEPQNLTILAVELHIRTRGDFYPDPQYDSVRAIFYSISNDVPEDFELPQQETGVIVVDTLPGSPVKQREPILNGTGVKCQINYVKSELELIDEFIKLIRKWDPDIFTGFEIEMLSWGYLIERCYVVGINLPVQISRTNPAIIKNKDKIQEGELKLTGRIILDAWRLFRHEITLQSYTFENLMFHILHQRVPQHSFKNLSFWWEYRSNYYRYITANYYINKVEGILKLLDHLDLIGRTCELARLFGIQFYEVLSRGSQFRVESMMLRLAKPLNYIPVSPSVQQRANMRSPEWVPLILEPESRFYSDPVIVLDFQSLYPSIIIAYNYCFSTCIGRVEKLGTNNPFEFGACQLKILRKQLEKLQEKLNFSPCGVGFVKPEVTKGVLPQMLTEILETRLMVKSSMKQNKNNKLLQRVLHNRQLGLKLIANVTYGYTSANFSGRMPCIEVGDSVVSKGRETLERAIKLIECNEKWRAKVVYGDTDSLFVLVPGRNKEDAFKIGAEMAETITNDNPPPVKLKLEKVYQPCILQTKKRYVGYMYESADQKEAEYNAKGIETVRRDGCPAVAKMLEKSLRLLFETKDMSLVKRYVLRQFEKLLSGRASLQDLIFAREFRGISGYRPGACVPALELARRWTSIDKRREPRRGERVPYVIVHGPPGLPLIRLVKSPMEVINPEQNISLRPNAVYYITRVIAPALNRCLGLVGADVLAWFNEMPRKQLHILPTEMHFDRSKKSTISQYFATMSCVVCNNQTRDGLCEECCHNPQQSVVILHEKLQQWERSYNEVTKICQSCCGRLEYTDCVSLDCPVLYRLHQIKKDLKQVPFVRNLLSKFS